MDRRDFIGNLALGTLVAPRIANAQTARKVYRIGILGLGQTSRIAGPQPQGPDMNAFVRGLRARARVRVRGAASHTLNHMPEFAKYFDEQTFSRERLRLKGA